MRKPKHEKSPLEEKIDDIILLLIAMFILLVVILGIVTYSYLTILGSDGSGYFVLNGVPIK